MASDLGGHIGFLSAHDESVLNNPNTSPIFVYTISIFGSCLFGICT